MSNSGLAEIFGAEWSQLCDWQRAMIEDDFRDVRASEDGATPFEYKRRIGAGNLTSYALARAAAWCVCGGIEPGAHFSIKE